MKQPALILAGTMEQARFHARRLGLAPPEWRYVTPRTAMGYDRPDVHVVGTYWERPDFHEARDALLPSRPRFLDERGHRVTFQGAPSDSRRVAVAGIDFSTFQIDVCLLSEDDDTASWHVFPFGKQGDAFDRARRIRDALPPRSWWSDRCIAVGIEDPRGASRKVDAPIYRAQGAILACIDPSLLVMPWKPQQWRSELGLPQRGKEALRKFALGRWTDAPDGVSQDLCDAFGIAWATRQRIVISAAA